MSCILMSVIFSTPNLT